MLAVEDEGTLAFHRADERTQLAAEFELVEHETASRSRRRRTAPGCPRCRGAGSRSRRDRSRPSAPASRAGRWRRARARIPRPRCAHRSRATRPRTSAPSANSMPSLFARTALASPGRKMSTFCKVRVGVGKQPRLDRAGDAHREPGQPARLGLELAAISVPVDEMRTDQRRHQRQDDHDRDAEQRRLHAVSKAGPSKRPPSERPLGRRARGSGNLSGQSLLRLNRIRRWPSSEHHLTRKLRRPTFGTMLLQGR